MKTRFALLVGLLALTRAVYADVGTAAQKNALFDTLVAKIMAREAFSGIKNRNLGLEFPRDLERHRERFTDAKTEDELYWAVVALSNARRDRHLSVERLGGEPMAAARDTAPILFQADFSTQPPSYAVANWSAQHIDSESMAIGDRVSAINGVAVAEYVESLKTFSRYSTLPNFYMRSARALNERSDAVPPSFYEAQLRIRLEKPNGSSYTVSVPYLTSDDASAAMPAPTEAKYPGFVRVLDTVSFDLYRPQSDERLLILDWYGFRDDIVESTNRLMDYAVEEGLLDYDLIFDGIRSRGGGRGAYAIQRIQGKAFRTTFGNLRLSDIAEQFVADRIASYRQGAAMSDGVRETVEGDSWLIDWFEDDVAKGFSAGQDYSNTVPFKLAHAPKWSDGVLQPAEVHFRGRLICWFSPYGGSHLDQFAAITADNDLCHSLGMPTGGYSNTWEAEEAVGRPDNGAPFAMLMYSIGHTVRPNGEVLEGNPPDVDEFFPQTSKPLNEYRQTLLERSRALLADRSWRSR